MKIIAIDVDYKVSYAIAAGVVFDSWDSPNESNSVTTKITNIEEYIPGKFYKRELPCITKLIENHNILPDVIIVDGFVYLDGEEQPGLGKYVFDYYSGRIPIVGVAKAPYKDISDKYSIFRGESKKPLYVTSAGFELENAKGFIMNMAGNHRLPTMLKKVDNLCRNAR